ncbi:MULTISPECIES: MurR/RpiR family transcriptional regulator [Roseateles]|uniref:MurR/RpiR family transcriptional regulator n=1 Tax=Roseateles TaxID=93681 RepID=UPI0022B87CAB|nr:MurR/RpiR family transcriptional regulator [Paucibacter sp. M5-1]MCZ7880776.1 MurR/RpiR family transcriptional regulator [Paucibacter sp. M5-1]
MSHSSNHKGLMAAIAEAQQKAPAARRAIFALMLEDPERVLDESFEALAARSGASVPTIMRACRDLGFAGLREFKLALAQEMAVGGSPLHRRVQLQDTTEQVAHKITRGAAGTIAGLSSQLDAQALDAAAHAIAHATRIDALAAGATSNFMAADLHARLFRLGLVSNAWSDFHSQLLAAATQGPGGVVVAISHVGGMPLLLEAVAVARAQGATVIALTQPGTKLAANADIVLGLKVPEDAVMHVGTEAYLAHLTAIEVLTVLIAKVIGEPAVYRLQSVREVLQRHGIDTHDHPLLNWQVPHE